MQGIFLGVLKFSDTIDHDISEQKLIFNNFTDNSKNFIKVNKQTENRSLKLIVIILHFSNP